MEASIGLLNYRLFASGLGTSGLDGSGQSMQALKPARSRNATSASYDPGESRLRTPKGQRLKLVREKCLRLDRVMMPGSLGTRSASRSTSHSPGQIDRRPVPPSTEVLEDAPRRTIFRKSGQSHRMFPRKLVCRSGLPYLAASRMISGILSTVEPKSAPMTWMCIGPAGSGYIFRATRKTAMPPFP